MNRAIKHKQQSNSLLGHIKKHWFLYLMVLPGVIWLFVFHYLPAGGIIIAFKDYKFMKGVMASPWIGLENFRALFRDKDFYRVVRNTVLINLYTLLVGTPFTIFLALMLNEIRSKSTKSVIQTAVYLPHFISWVVFAGLIGVLLSPSTGIVNKLIVLFGGDSIYFMSKPEYFRSIVVGSSVLKNTGWGTIIYLAAISGVNPELYECAVLDGANRFHLMWHITLPRIKPTIAVLLILNVSSMFASNFEQIFNLYNTFVYSTGDVISTFLYRRGLLEGKFEMATTLGLVSGLISIITILITNRIIKKMGVIGII